MRKIVLATVVLGLAACDNSALPDAPPPAPAGPKVVVTALVREFDPAATKHDATWVAVERTPGAWTVLTSVAPGTYEFEATGQPWAIAVACADTEDAFTSVTVHRRTAATTALSFVLDRQCAGIGDAHTITGTLRNLPPLSGWFDFGYVDEARGVAIPSDASTSYELVNVFDGTWDLAFGVRNSPGEPLTRVALLRKEVIATDHTLDVDLGGPSSFVPTTKAILVRGMTEVENLQPVIRYAAGGAAGIDVGPPNVPNTVPDVKGDYATFPANVVQPTDFYRGNVFARDGKEIAERAVHFSIHTPIDLDLTLPPPLTPPEVNLAPGGSSALVRTRMAASGGAGARYRIRARVRLRGRQDHRWLTTFDADTARASIDDTMPDLSQVPGFRARWALPIGEQIEITSTVTEAETPLGDGTMERATTAVSYIVP